MKTTRMFTLLVLALGLMLSAGEMTLAGSIVGWGESGRLGDVPDGDDFVAIAAGEHHNLALKSDGSIVGWGVIPAGDVPDGNDFVAIAAGGNDSLALRSDGSIVGRGPFMGDPFVGVPGGNDFVAIAIAVDGYHGLALRSDGSIVGWGDNSLGQIDVPAGNDFVAIAAGFHYSLALKSDGSLVGWGWNDCGQIDVPAGNDFVAIAAGNDHSLALKSDGSIVGWGSNSSGQVDVPDGNDFMAVAAGFWYSLALKADGSIEAWGRLGSRSRFVTYEPPEGDDFVAIAAGGEHSLALRVIPLVSGFTYQGRLLDNNAVADGLYDLEFKLFDDAASGTQIGDTITVHELDVIDGYFTVALDFPSDPNTFDGTERWLQIGVRPGNSTGSFTILSPRQKITPVPYALYALSSGAGPGPGPMVVGGSGTDNYIPRWLGTTDLEDSVIYQDDMGNVGIGPGMTNPEERLDVSWSGGVNARIGRYNYLGACFSSATMVLGNNVRARTDNVNGIVVGQPHNVYGYRAITMSMNGIQFYGHTGTVNVGDPLDAATERMRITNEGNVGIGTTTPRSILEVVGEVGNSVTTFTTFPTSGSSLDYGTQGIGLNLVRKSTGTWEAAGDGSNNAGAAIFGSIGQEGLRFVTVESTGSVNQTFTDSQIMGKIRMVINSAGNVGIGTINPGGYKLNVAGNAYATSWNTPSDLRFKENIKTIDSPIDKIKNIRGVSFEWKTSEYKDKGFPKGRHYGVIAQEIEHALPDVVREGPDGEKAVSYTDLVPILAEAIKEQQKQIESLRSEVHKLREVIQQHRFTATKEVQP